MNAAIDQGFADADLDDVVSKLTVEELTALISGKGPWFTVSIPRFNIPSIKVSDGPNGIRGERFFNGTTAYCIPCATALASTWNLDLVASLAKEILAPEMRLRTSSLCLAPTVNIPRSPLGGRTFEQFGEDPHLSGTMAAAYINGLQNEGIGCTIKHLVCNDQENARHGSDAIVSPRALREVYLMPFMIAQRASKPWSYMAAYNRLNGLHCSEHQWLLQTVLRDEWGFDGLVMSDWYGVYSVDLSINAGLDLEMPGVRGLRCPNIIERALVSYKLDVDDLRARAKFVLGIVQKAAKRNTQVVYGDSIEHPPTDTPAKRQLLQRAAAESIVLLRNENSLLPLDKTKLRKIAIMGPNAKARVIYGGGAAQLKEHYVITPYDGIATAVGPDVEVLYAEGTRANKVLPRLDYDLETPDGQRGLRMEYFSHDLTTDKPLLDKPVRVLPAVTETSINLNDASFNDLTPRWTVHLRGYLTPRDVDGIFEFGLGCIGRAKLYIDDNLVVDNWTNQRRGQSFYFRGTAEERGTVAVKKGVKHSILVEFNNMCPILSAGPIWNPAVRFGGAMVVDDEEEMEKAERVAKEADVAIVVVGLNADWESEQFDRTTLSLPFRTDELVERVAKSNPRTIVVNQSGSAISMPWLAQVPAMLQAWYGGSSAGSAIADILFGLVNPSAKLSLTFPKCIEDTPSFGHFGSKNGSILYNEDLWVGYRHYVDRAIEPLFPFGHGLSFTQFRYKDLALSRSTVQDKDPGIIAVEVNLVVENFGVVKGSEVVQIYVSPPSHPLLEPIPTLTLRGFARVNDIEPGKAKPATVSLDKYAFSAWEEKKNAWIVRSGVYRIAAAASSVDIRLTAELEIMNDIYWTGL